MNRPSRILRSLALIALTGPWLVAGCSRSRPAAAVTEDAESAPVEQNDAVSEIVVLATETKDRCLGIARRALTRHETTDTKDSYSMYRFLNEETREDRAAADEATEIATRLLTQLRDVLEDRELRQALNDFVRAQSKVCKAAFQSFYYKSAYENRINSTMAELGKAERTIRRLAPVSDATRSRVLAKYSRQLDLARQSAVDEKMAKIDASDWRFDYKPEELIANPEERREQSEAWRREQEWLAQQHRVQRELHRDVMASWKGKSGQASMPTLGAVVVEEEDVGGPMAKMVSWYRTYLQRSELAHLAMTQLGMVHESSDRRYLRACKSLFNATGSLLADPEALDSPDKAVAELLKKAYEQLQDGAEACLGGDPEGASAQIVRGLEGLEKADQILARYGVASFVSTRDRQAGDK